MSVSGKLPARYDAATHTITVIWLNLNPSFKNPRFATAMGVSPLASFILLKRKFKFDARPNNE